MKMLPNYITVAYNLSDYEAVLEVLCQVLKKCFYKTRTQEEPLV